MLPSDVSEAAARCLKRLLEADPIAANELLTHSVACSEAVGDDPTIITDGGTRLSALGLINGILLECGGNPVASVTPKLLMLQPICDFVVVERSEVLP